MPFFKMTASARNNENTYSQEYRTNYQADNLLIAMDAWLKYLWDEMEKEKGGVFLCSILVAEICNKCGEQSETAKVTVD